ncbi:hypothetical protein D9M68_392240 [compost metagenome]
MDLGVRPFLRHGDHQGRGTRWPPLPWLAPPDRQWQPSRLAGRPALLPPSPRAAPLPQRYQALRRGDNSRQQGLGRQARPVHCCRVRQAQSLRLFLLLLPGRSIRLSPTRHPAPYPGRAPSFRRAEPSPPNSLVQQRGGSGLALPRNPSPMWCRRNRGRQAANTQSCCLAWPPGDNIANPASD